MSNFADKAIPAFINAGMLWVVFTSPILIFMMWCFYGSFMNKE